MSHRTTAAAVLLAGLAGCASCDSVPDAAVTDCNAQIVPGGAAADLLFVIDDSGSMSQEQDELAANLGAFIDQLLGSAIALDVRLGVTNTSVEDYVLTNGTATRYGRAASVQIPPDPPIQLAFPGPRGTPYPRGTLVAIEQLEPSGVGTAGHFLWGAAYDDPSHVTSTWGGPRVLSSAAARVALARDFKANVMQGIWGSSREQPLAAMKLALEKAGCPGPNCGFLRAGARLTVVILTDEDDCSGPRNGTITNDGACQNSANWGRLDALSDFVDYLATVGGPGSAPPLVALIAGYDASGVPSLCKGTDYGTTTEGYSLPNRLDAFMSLVDPALATTTRGPRALKASICRPFAEALRDIASAVIPQTMPLRQAPADYQMIAPSIQRATGEVVTCGIPALAPNPAANVVYTPAPQGGGTPSLTFQNACRIGVGDKVNLSIICAR